MRKYTLSILSIAISLTACSYNSARNGMSPVQSAFAVQRPVQSAYTVARAVNTAPPPDYVFPQLRALATGTGFKTLYQFGSITGDAAGVQARMVPRDGILYGVSHGGGSAGYGTFFSFDPKTDTENVLYSFQNGADGWGPEAFPIFYNGAFYGTTASLPEPGFPDGQGNGAIYSITPTGQLSVLHDFAGSPDGANPEGFLYQLNGLLYGTTFVGGTGTCTYSSSDGCGTVFSIDPTTGAETVLYSFQGGTDGAGPRDGLTYVNGAFYGSTYFGGPNGAGTVFRITPSGAETVLHSFGGAGDGVNPQSALLLLNGVLYGTTNRAGSLNGGVVYEITTAGAESVVASVCCGPEGGVIQYNGVMYGTTSGDGSAGSGSVYSLTTSGIVTLLHGFTGGVNGGALEDGLTTSGGRLFGTTRLSGAHGVGTIFKINP